MTNIVGITVYGVLYLLAMVLLLILFFLGKNWLMFIGLSGFLIMGERVMHYYIYVSSEDYEVASQLIGNINKV